MGDDASWAGGENSHGLDLDRASEVEEALKADKSQGNPYLNKDGKTQVTSKGAASVKSGAIVPVNK